MTRTGLLFGATVSVIAGLCGAGCGDAPFSATGGTGGATVSTGGGGDGGTGAATATETGGTGGTGAGGATGGTGGTGAGGATGGTGGAATCQPLSNMCAECAYDACYDLYCACYAELDCAALVNCLQPCDPTDTACQQPCLTDHEDSISKAFLLGDCAATNMCSGVCMGIAVLPSCPKCLFTDCTLPMNDCLADPECREILDCVTLDCAPGDSACQFGCAGGKSEPSINKALAVQYCTSQGQPCEAACAQ